MTGAPDLHPPLLPRDRHLFGPGPKRLLALDGGGVRGAISVAFLERLEEILLDGREHRRLCDVFDFVGGTSTGAIIAGALALGYRAAEIRDFYVRLAPHAFRRDLWRLPLLQSRFDARDLRGELDAVIGERTLASADIQTGLGVVTKRVDTGSPWIITNNPRAPYWESGTGYVGNKHYRLSALVRASTAAPHFFDPELIAIASDEEALPQSAMPPRGGVLRSLARRLGFKAGSAIDPGRFGLFVDGGVSPHNNPSLAFFQTVTLKSFGICWPHGPDNLTIVSLGTGSHRLTLDPAGLGIMGTPRLALHSLLSMMKDTETSTLALMQWLGQCPRPWEINSEIGSLADDVLPGGNLFRFFRYDVRLDRDWLSRELGVDVTDRQVDRLRLMDDPSAVGELYEIGRIAADRFVKAEDWSRSPERATV